MNKYHEFYNPNPKGKNTGDCAVRALTKALGITWGHAKVLLAVYSCEMGEVENSDVVWGRILYDRGFRQRQNDFCKGQCDLNAFCSDHPHGDYVVKLPGHVVSVSDGKFWDSWDSGAEIPLYYWKKYDK